MKIVRVIESRVWVNKVTGLKASIYGACPWTSEKDRPNWEMVTRGYTWEMSNGTVGFGRVPAKTYDEAVEVMNKFNARVPARA